MTKNEKIHKVYTELVSFYQGLKAEVVVVELLKNSGLDIKDIDVLNTSTFTRSFRRDIVATELNTFTKTTDKIRLNLARNGLYDKLPEGLFHQPVRSDEPITFAEVRLRNKQNEKEARSFFSPLENEFFNQKVQIEEKEVAFINRFTDLNDKFFQDFWKLDKDIPPAYANKLLRLLPYGHKISGNLKLMALCLEHILEEKVTIVKKNKVYKYGSSAPKGIRLGVDMTLGMEETDVYYPVAEITVGPLKKDKTEQMIDAKTKKFISTFCDYFLPLEFDVETIVKVVKEDSNFVLDLSDNPRIGLTTLI